MSWKEKIRNPFVQQYAVEILFPLIGFFFFDWSLIVIAVFYLMDQVGAESAFVRRLSRVAREKQAPLARILTWSIVAFLLVFVLQVCFLFLVGFELIYLHPPIADELTTFMKEEGWFLFPLVIFMYHFKDQFVFYMPRRFVNYNPVKMQLYRFIGNFTILVLTLGCFAVLYGIPMQPWLILVIFLVVKISFDFTVAKWVDRKSKN